MKNMIAECVVITRLYLVLGLKENDEWPLKNVDHLSFQGVSFQVRCVVSCIYSKVFCFDLLYMIDQIDFVEYVRTSHVVYVKKKII